MAASSSASEKVLEMPITELPRVYWAAATTSRATEAEWKELAADRLSAECIACGIKLSGTEIRQLGPAYASEAPENAKLERIRLGYCARNSCESRFYRVQLEPDSDLHWKGFKDQLQLSNPEVHEAKAPRVRLRTPSLGLGRLRPGHYILGVVAAVVLFFLIRHWIYGYRIPVVQKKNEYRLKQPEEMR